MKVLLAVASLRPDYGGPAFSVSGLAVALGELGVEVGVWASDQSAETAGLISDSKNVVALSGSESDAVREFGQPTILHDNGIWMPHNHRLASLASEYGIPRVVSPRGMLEPWALNYKKWKKRLAWWLYQCDDLKRAQCIHVTAPSEAQNVLRFGFASPVVTIGNGVMFPRDDEIFRPVDNTRGIKTALYLGRIHPKKGLIMLIEAWSRVRPDNWQLQIVGPDERNHRKEVYAAVRENGLNKVVSVLPAVGGLEKQQLLCNADLFILPTYSENFGIVVPEALAHGLPVLTTSGAPWPMLPEKGCGWWVDATVNGLAEGLRRATALNPDVLRAMGLKGRDWVQREFGWRTIAIKFVEAYRAVA